MTNQPIEEKWKESLNSLLFKSIDLKSENARPMSIKLSDELVSFIENLLEQERKRMSEEIYQARKSNTTDSADDVWEKVLSIINK